MVRDADYLRFVRSLTGAENTQAPSSVSEERAATTAAMSRVPREPVGAITNLGIPRLDGTVLPARLYRPRVDTLGTVLVFVHGGGWRLGSLDSWDPVVRTLVNACGVSLLAIDQRLAPEYPFPGAVEDTVTALAWTRDKASELGYASGRVGVSGDSSGGNVAAAACLWLAHRKQPTPAVQVLIYPPLDVCNVPADEPDPDGLNWNRPPAHQIVAPYLAGASPEDPAVSPLLAEDLTGLPPAVVATAEYDRLRVQGERYAARLREAEIDVELVDGLGLDHGYLAWVSYARQPRLVVTRIGAAVRRALDVTA